MSSLSPGRPSGLYTGIIKHERYLPKEHKFAYPFFMWLLNLDEIHHLPDLGIWFSPRRFALSRFRRSDYLGNPETPLHVAVKQRMEQLTGQKVQGPVYGLLNLNSLGIYFSPVNFYFGYDSTGHCSHFLAEVSNTPWNERHHYSFMLDNGSSHVTHDKQFHVSPFNPDKQIYHWAITPPGDSLAIDIAVDDERGHVFKAILRLSYAPLTLKTVRQQLLKKPVMTGLTLLGIYWQALRIYLKKIPYVPYQKENI